MKLFLFKEKNNYFIILEKILRKMEEVVEQNPAVMIAFV